MRKLIDGIHEFRQVVFEEQKSLFDELAKGQKPLALFITCSDSRIDPNLLTQTRPGELFIIRNAGNIVPPYSAAAGGEAGTIEYAVTALKVKDIVICGHSFCGAMDGLLHPEHLVGLSAVQGWLKHADATERILRENFPDVTDKKARLATAVEQNVLVQLENLRTHPSVAAALARGDVELHGWTYHFESGQVFGYDAEEKKFLPVENVAAGDYSP